MLEPLLTTRQAAFYLKIHPETLRGYVRAGKVRAYRLGNKLRFNTADLDYFIKQHATIKENLKCSIEGKIQVTGGLRSRSTDEQYNALLGLTTKPKLKNTTTK